jgi:hypothetical protein
MLQFLRMPIALLSKPNKSLQAAGSICLAKVIQNASEELVGALLDELTERICGIIRMSHFKSHSALLETLISLIFHVEQKIEPFAEKLLEIMLEQVKNDDSLTKKVSIDAIYALTAIIKDQIAPFRF